MSNPPPLTGSCLCGAVRFEAHGAPRPVIVCHCGQCRKWSGHQVAATAVPRDGLRLIESRGLKWYRSSDFAGRGFCAECGSSLFWQHDREDHTSIMAGTLDSPTGLETGSHIYVADCGDYYQIEDGLPRFEEDGGGADKA